MPSRCTLINSRLLGRKPGELLFQQQAVGAEINVLPPANEAFDERLDFRIDQRLAAADAYDRRAALAGRGQALRERKPLVHRVGVFANPPAAGAGEVAGVQRFEHQNQRKVFFARQPLPQQVAGHRAGQREGKSHGGWRSVASG